MSHIIVEALCRDFWERTQKDLSDLDSEVIEFIKHFNPQQYADRYSIALPYTLQVKEHLKLK